MAISDASKLGKKIKCSKCSEVFVAKAMSSGSSKAGKPAKPVPKPKKSDEDEFSLRTFDSVTTVLRGICLKLILVHVEFCV